ncbi:MAG: NusG domain II-containing protein [Clostridia bacterium]|nr:NusG domain II-containing protein [Clostridia bacterium]
MKKNDIILLCSVLLIAAIAFFMGTVLLDGSGDTVVVAVNGAEYARLPLDENTELLIQAENGTNKLIIKDGEAYITEASCPDKICVKTGKVTEMRSVVCLPNKVTVTLEKGD